MSKDSMRVLRWVCRTMAKRCGWCAAPMSPEDAEAICRNPDILITTGICADCMHKHFGDLLADDREFERLGNGEAS